MSLNTGSTTPPPASSTASSAVPAAQAAQPSKTWSFHRPSFGKSPLGRGLGSEVASKLKEALVELYKTSDPAFEMNILEIDNSNAAAWFSCLIICVRDKSNTQDMVAYHTLIVEGSADPIPAKVESQNGNNWEILYVASDAYDDDLIAMIRARVSKAYPNSTLLPVEAAVVPRNFNVEDKSAIHGLALNAGLACSTELTVKSSAEDYNLVHAERDSKLSVSLQFSRQVIENAVKAPVRADVMVTFQSQQKQQVVNQSVNSEDRATIISKTTGYIDLVYAPVAPQNMGFPGMPNNPFAQNQQQQTQQYAARLVVTSIDSMRSRSIASMLLSLMTTAAVSQDQNWWQAMRSLPVAGQAIQMNDIGALGVEYPGPDGRPLGKRIDTQSADFTLNQFGQLVASLVRPGLMVSVDVPEYGPETWDLQVFTAASSYGGNAADAIYKGAMQLTNGNFERYFPYNTPMFVDINNRVHLGYWIDAQGQQRDIRDIDYLAVANIVGERDVDVIKSFSDTYTKTQYPLAQRLHERKKIIQAIVPSAVFTGFANRVTFSGEFLEALSKAARDCNLTMNITTPMNTGDLQNQRGVASYVASAIIPSTGGIFSGDMGFNQGTGAGAGNFANNHWRV